MDDDFFYNNFMKMMQAQWKMKMQEKMASTMFSPGGAKEDSQADSQIKLLMERLDKAEKEKAEEAKWGLLNRKIEELEKEKQKTGTDSTLQTLINEIKTIKDGWKKEGKDEKGIYKLKELETKLEKKLEEIKEDKRLQELKLILNSKESGGDKAVYQAMMGLYKDRDKTIDEFRKESEVNRMQLLQTQLTNQLEKFDQKLSNVAQGGKLQVNEFKDTIQAIKSISAELRSDEKKDSTHDLIRTVTDTIKGPILEPVGQAIGDRIRLQREAAQMDPYMMQQLQQHQQQMQQYPSESYVEIEPPASNPAPPTKTEKPATKPKPGKYDDLVNVM